ncbi:unnamed protein product, partial [Porites evermanni]
KCTPAQRKAVLKAADDALVRTISECVFNVLKETVPVSKPAKRKLLKHKKALTALAEKSTPLNKKKQILVQHGGNFLSVLLPPVLRVRMVLVPENTPERLQQLQQILTPPVKQTLKNLDSQMGDILESKQLGDEEKAKLYNQVLQRYLTYYDQRKGQPLHVKVREESPESPSPGLPTPPVTLSSVKKQRRRVESPRPQAVRWLRL